jgi:hypothetical protein
VKKDSHRVQDSGQQILELESVDEIQEVIIMRIAASFFTEPLVT